MTAAARELLSALALRYEYLERLRTGKPKATSFLNGIRRLRRFRFAFPRLNEIARLDCQFAHLAKHVNRLIVTLEYNYGDKEEKAKNLFSAPKKNLFNPCTVTFFFEFLPTWIRLSSLRACL